MIKKKLNLFFLSVITVFLGGWTFFLGRCWDRICTACYQLKITIEKLKKKCKKLTDRKQLLIALHFLQFWIFSIVIFNRYYAVFLHKY